MPDQNHPNPETAWPLLLRVIAEARRIAANRAMKYVAAKQANKIHLIPAQAVGIGCTILFTWTPTSLRKGLSLEQITDLLTHFAANAPNNADPNTPIVSTYDPAPTLFPEELETPCQTSLSSSQVKSTPSCPTSSTPTEPPDNKPSAAATESYSCS